VCVSPTTSIMGMKALFKRYNFVREILNCHQNKTPHGFKKFNDLKKMVLLGTEKYGIIFVCLRKAI
jgi:hypothetical protein